MFRFPVDKCPGGSGWWFRRRRFNAFTAAAARRAAAAAAAAAAGAAGAYTPEASTSNDSKYCKLFSEARVKIKHR